MARVNVTVTTEWQLVSSTETIITIAQAPSGGAGQLLINTSASDTAALGFTPQDLSEQIIQNSVETTYVKAREAGWVITVDDKV